MEETKKQEFAPKNLRMGCHFYNKHMEMVKYTYSTSDADTKKYFIPLKKEILDAIGFEPEYDEYTHELYFQCDYSGYRIRISPMDGTIKFIDLKYLHTVVDVKAESLNELENFMYALGIEPDYMISKEAVVREINAFGKKYFDYFNKWGRTIKEYYEKCDERKKEEK